MQHLSRIHTFRLHVHPLYSVLLVETGKEKKRLSSLTWAKKSIGGPLQFEKCNDVAVDFARAASCELFHASSLINHQCHQRKPKRGTSALNKPTNNRSLYWAKRSASIHCSRLRKFAYYALQHRRLVRCRPSTLSFSSPSTLRPKRGVCLFVIGTLQTLVPKNNLELLADWFVPSSQHLLPSRRDSVLTIRLLSSDQWPLHEHSAYPSAALVLYNPPSMGHLPLNIRKNRMDITIRSISITWTWWAWMNWWVRCRCIWAAATRTGSCSSGGEASKRIRSSVASFYAKHSRNLQRKASIRTWRSLVHNYFNRLE